MTMIDGPSGPAETTPRDWGAVPAEYGSDPYDDQDALRTLNGSHVTRQEVLRQIAANSQPYDPVVVPPGTAFVATENGVRAAAEEEIARSLQFDNRTEVPPVPPTPHRHVHDDPEPMHDHGQPLLEHLTEAHGVPLGLPNEFTWKDHARLHYPLERLLADRREQPEQRADAVNHPPHYGGDVPYEAIKVIEAWGLGFCLGNTVKYISRADHKGTPIEDLKKARWYLDREIMRREQTTEEEH